MSQNQQRVCNLSKQPQRLHYHGIVLGVAPDPCHDVELPAVSQSMRRNHLASRQVQRLCDAGVLRVYVGAAPAVIAEPPVAEPAPAEPPVAEPAPAEPPVAEPAPAEPPAPARLSLDAFSALTPKTAKLDYLLKVCGHDAPDNLTHLQLNDLYEEMFAPKE
jgi:hypothetical protein